MSRSVHCASPRRSRHSVTSEMQDCCVGGLDRDIQD